MGRDTKTSLFRSWNSLHPIFARPEAGRGGAFP